MAAIDLRGRVERHPYAMVAAALGVGYVLGGGLFSALTFRLLGLGVRVAAVPVVKNQLLGLAGAAVSGFTGGSEVEAAVGALYKGTPGIYGALFDTAIATATETVAVLRFSGDRSPKAVAARTAELLEALQDNGIKPTGEADAWFYDPPWTLPFRRRNESAIPVDPGSAPA